MRRAGSQVARRKLIVLQGSIDGGGTVVIDHRPDSPREPLVHVLDCECKFAQIPFKEIPKSKVENPPVHIDWLLDCRGDLPAFRVRRPSLSEEVKIEICRTREHLNKL